MLRWIAEMEGSSDQQKTGHKCPACKAPIIIEEPYDPIVAFRDKLYRKYSRISPYILLVIVSGGTMAGAAAYGWSAACIFAGHDAVSRWFGTFSRRRIPSTTLKVVFLSALGPGLVITRWLSSLGTVVLLPFSVLVSSSQAFGNLSFDAWHSHTNEECFLCAVQRLFGRSRRPSDMAAIPPVGNRHDALCPAQLQLPLL